MVQMCLRIYISDRNQGRIHGRFSRVLLVRDSNNQALSQLLIVHRPLLKLVTYSVHFRKQRRTDGRTNLQSGL